MSHLILVLNPGSTSTKAAVYSDEHPVCSTSLLHSNQDLAPFPTLLDQLDYRVALVRGWLAQEGIDLSTLSAVVGRGGIIPNIVAGGYVVDDNLVDSMEPILTLEENGVYAYYPAGGETFYHSGWYTVDDRVITLEDTQGNLRTAIYVNGTIYLVEGDGVVSVVHRMRQNAEYENISIDTLPSPRT